MAVSFICGFEMGHLAEARNSSNAVSVQSTVKRNGSYALRMNPAASASGSQFNFADIASGNVQRSVFLSGRVQFRVDTMTNNACRVFGSSGAQNIVLNTNGSLALYNGSTLLATSAAGVVTADATFHELAIDCQASLTQVLYDRQVVASHATAFSTQSGWACLANFLSGTTITCDFYFDDVVCYSSALPGTLNDYNVSMLLPVADSNRGGWTAGAGGTTNLWQAIDNVPPAGTVTGSQTNTTTIKSATNSATDNYDGTCATYDSITGLTTAAQVLAVQAICNDAQEVTTGSPKAGAVVIASNPTGQTEQGFDYGIPNGLAASGTAAAVGAFPTGWGTHHGPVTDTPTVTVSSGPVVRVGKRTATTRVVDVDFLGVYVMWEAAGGGASTVSPPLDMRDRRIRRNSLLRR